MLLRVKSKSSHSTQIVSQCQCYSPNPRNVQMGVIPWPVGSQGYVGGYQHGFDQSHYISLVYKRYDHLSKRVGHRE